jgi:hypothetical protein
MQVAEYVAVFVLGGAFTAWALFTAWGISWWRETREYREMLTKFKRQLQREYDADLTLAETASILLNYGLAEPHLGERNDYKWVPEVVAGMYERLKVVEQRGAAPAAKPACGCASCVPPAAAEAPGLPAKPDEELCVLLARVERVRIEYSSAPRKLERMAAAIDDVNRKLAAYLRPRVDLMRMTTIMNELLPELHEACHAYAGADEADEMGAARAKIERAKAEICAMVASEVTATTRCCTN